MVDPIDDEKALKVPLWFWNSAEWCSFTQASAKTQRPLLRRALREVKTGRNYIYGPSREEKKLELRRYLSSRRISIQRDLLSGAIQMEENKFGFRLSAIASDLEEKIADFKECEYGLETVLEAIRSALDECRHIYNKGGEKIELPHLPVIYRTIITH